MDNATERAHTGENIVVPVIKEELEIQKRTVETGRVRLNKTVSEQDVVVEEQRIQEEIHIERIPIDRFIDQPAAMRHDGDTLIIPVMEEVPVVVKRLKLKEELHVTKRRIAAPQSQPVRLRSETVTIERLDPRPASDVQGTDGKKTDGEK
jgi:uncharacterized protein (TIGR02271 family)